MGYASVIGRSVIGRSAQEAFEKANNVMKKVSNYMESNKLHINAGKG